LLLLPLVEHALDPDTDFTDNAVVFLLLFTPATRIATLDPELDERDDAAAVVVVGEGEENFGTNDDDDDDEELTTADLIA
jgi:hypothetical protein